MKTMSSREKTPDADRMKSAIDGYYFHGTNATNEIKEGGFKKGEYFNSGAYFSSDLLGRLTT